MNEMHYEELIRLSLRPVLTPEEEAQVEAFLSQHPEARADWEEERLLSRAIVSLPDVPVSNNFTSSVLQAVELAERQDQRRHGARPLLRLLLPRVGWVVATALVVFIVVHEQRVARRLEVVKGLVKDLPWVPTDLASISSPEVLQDFDAIRQLQQVSATSDEELLKALQ